MRFYSPSELTTVQLTVFGIPTSIYWPIEWLPDLSVEAPTAGLEGSVINTVAPSAEAQPSAR
jgi:hypothetical protein